MNANDEAGRQTLLAQYKADGTPLAVYTATYDPSGNRTKVEELDGVVVSTSYDAAGQLTREQRSGANAYDTSYTYDAAGNRLTKEEAAGTTAYDYDAANQLLVVTPPSGDPTTHTWDRNGNLHVENCGGALTTYTWDDDNRLVGVSHPDGRIETHTYDPATGLRRKKETPGAGRIFVWQGQNVLVETDLDLVVQAEYTDLPGMWGGLVSQRRGEVSSFFGFDLQSSTRLLVSVAGEVTDTETFKAFGESLASSGSTEHPYRYVGEQGYQWEEEDRYYVRARHLDVADGRWLSRDPIGFLGGWNLYEYVANRPPSSVDPLGWQGAGMAAERAVSRQHQEADAARARRKQELSQRAAVERQLAERYRPEIDWYRVEAACAKRGIPFWQVDWHRYRGLCAKAGIPYDPEVGPWVAEQVREERAMAAFEKREPLLDEWGLPYGLSASLRSIDPVTGNLTRITSGPKGSAAWVLVGANYNLAYRYGPFVPAANTPDATLAAAHGLASVRQEVPTAIQQRMKAGTWPEKLAVDMAGYFVRCLERGVRPPFGWRRPLARQELEMPRVSARISRNGQVTPRGGCPVKGLYSCPASADIFANMRKAHQHRLRAGQTGYLNHVNVWFREQVRAGGIWDYKWEDPVGILIYGRSRYEDWGNFHFGAVAYAAGIPLSAALRAAGKVNVGDNPGRIPREWGTPGLLPGNQGKLAQAIAVAGLGSQWPYGDDPIDQLWSEQGWLWAKASFGRR